MAVDVEVRPTKMARRKVSSKSGVMRAHAAPGHLEAAQAPIKRPLRIVMSSPKGGVGKTGTCRNLAVAAALEGFKVATVDFDPQKSLTKWWEDRPMDAPDLEHFATTIGNVDTILAEITDYDFVFYDTATAIEEHIDDMKKLLVAADMIIVPTQASKDDRNSTFPWMSALRKIQPKSHFLLNRVRPQTTIFTVARNLLVGTGHPLCPVEVPDYMDFQEAAELGVGILELRRAKGQEQIKGVWSYVRNTVGVVKT